MQAVDLRFAPFPLTPINFLTGSSLSVPLLGAGSTIHVTVGGLQPGQDYYFSARAADGKFLSPNFGPIPPQSVGAKTLGGSGSSEASSGGSCSPSGRARHRSSRTCWAFTCAPPGAC